MKRLFITTTTLIALIAAGHSMAADIAAGKAKAQVCASCHGADGISKVPTYPNLAGQKAAYTAKQLKAFRDASRKEPTMNAMAKPLTDADIENLAAFYESLK